MFRIDVGEFSISVQDGGLPEIYSEYVRHADFELEMGLESSEGRLAFCSVGRGSDWPFCVLSFRYAPAGSGFSPGVLLVPETGILFAGAGTLLFAVDLNNRRLLWEDLADVGFWSWQRHGDTVLMAAELELAAWGIRGEGRWRTFVEPPWSYEVRDGTVELDVMGKISKFSLRSGPPAS